MIKQLSLSELISNESFSSLVSEYSNECSNSRLPPTNWNAEIYKRMEDAGLMLCVGAFKDHNMIGFMTVLTTVYPHYNQLVATTESLFVSKRHRKSGAGIRLIKFGENIAKEAGAIGLYMSAPVNSSLSRVAEKIGYTKTNEVFFKRILYEHR